MACVNFQLRSIGDVEDANVTQEEVVEETEGLGCVGEEKSANKVEGFHITINGGYSIDHILLHLYSPQEQQGSQLAPLRPPHDQAALSMQRLHEIEPNTRQVNVRRSQTGHHLSLGQRCHLAAPTITQLDQS